MKTSSILFNSLNALFIFGDVSVLAVIITRFSTGPSVDNVLRCVSCLCSTDKMSFANNRFQQFFDKGSADISAKGHNHGGLLLDVYENIQHEMFSPWVGDKKLSSYLTALTRFVHAQRGSFNLRALFASELCWNSESWHKYKFNDSIEVYESAARWISRPTRWV